MPDATPLTDYTGPRICPLCKKPWHIHGCQSWELADAIDARDRRIKELEADGPGTPRGRLTAITKFAEKEAGHDPFSYKQELAKTMGEHASALSQRTRDCAKAVCFRCEGGHPLSQSGKTHGTTIGGQACHLPCFAWPIRRAFPGDFEEGK